MVIYDDTQNKSNDKNADLRALTDIVSFVNKFAYTHSLIIYAASGEELNPKRLTPWCSADALQSRSLMLF
ncbi:hypothetical protein A8139_14425 [Marinomonas primoryensis]|uniref:Uncharacterized protein n=1 Tax=Marinomonas primoryensis TaxID=178399 RepID=A0A2Z4PTX3_9GAMM|nr:hypothetical protein A8139_14425 [Marinomonas primoryensis]